MSQIRSAQSRYRSLHASRRALARAAPMVRYGLFAVGISVFLDQVRPLVSDAQFTWGERRVMGIVALVTIGGFVLSGWIAGRLLRAAAEMMEVVVDGAEAAVQTSYLIEAQVVPALVRAATALERLAENATGDAPSRAAVAVRRAISEGRWGRAEQLLQGLRRDDPEAPALAAELARARRAEADDLYARLDAARSTDDPDEVIACRDGLTRHLRGDALHDLDQRVVRWLYDLIQKRVQGGLITPELAALAARVTDSFGDTAEGAALLAALPRLRKQAGLCTVCARPHRGNADACPDCHVRRSASGPRGASTEGHS
jgi:hypothetical protein